MIKAFAGIDVAFAKNKRLPLCLCTREDQQLRVLPLRKRCLPKPPSGKGNRAALVQEQVQKFALETLRYLRTLEIELGLAVQVIALDCPRRPRRKGEEKRRAEAALGSSGLRYIATPSQAEFEAIKHTALKFLQEGGEVNRLPNANRLWMLVGFELFSLLEQHYECREVFPQAIAERLQCASQHKTSREGYQAQLAAAAGATGYSKDELVRDLQTCGYGSRHDRLDAYFSAWIASLPLTQLENFGEPPWDVIWVPRSCKTGTPRPGEEAVGRATRKDY